VPRRLTPVLTAVLGVITVAGIAGCSSDPALTVYSGRNEALVAPLIEQFETETGIDVEVRYGTTAELAALLAEEGEATPADLFFAQDAGALGAVSDAGLFLPLPQTTLDSVDVAYRGSAGDWVGTSGRARVIAYNSEALTAEQVPTSVFDLTDPQWSGRIGIAPTNASFQSFLTAMRVAEGDERTTEWLEGLAANDPVIYEGNVDILNAVDSGEIDLGLINHYYWYEAAAERGADTLTAQISFTEPGDPGSLVNVAGVGILSDNADAQAFVDFLLSETGQQYFAETTYEYPLIAGVPAADGLPPLASLQGPDVALDDLDSLAETQELLTQVGLI
jgi:iron(III) transport system substrate-binding protein